VRATPLSALASVGVEDTPGYRYRVCQCALGEGYRVW
jgi:hypothetical protein